MSGLRIFWNNKYIFSGTLIVSAITLLGVIGFFYHPYNPMASFASNLPPSRLHILGTNFFGNDIWSQYLVGILPTIEIGLAGALLGMVVALFVGLLSGYARGLKNEILTFFINVFLLIPGLPLAIVISSDLQASHANLGNLALILVITITGWATGARTIRSQVLSLSSRDYITFIKHTGESHLNIIFREILPSLLSYVGYIFTNLVVFSIILETSLLFLGLGNETIISLGSILYYANSYSAILLGEWWWFIPPGLTIAFLGVGFGLISLGLDVIANPSLRVFKKAKGSQKKNSNKILKAGEEM
ncbi:ABC transporter permease [Thermoplasma sp.]|uniref:ABC transporter permease n=1 Tax=Thermoplasma sp. TaxID=1973142 RepID=UPI002612C7FC|nr:ABC transporter permease [Thermoplasma sp.]